MRPSILLEAKADLLTFGMGENQTRQIASKLGQGLPVSSLRDIRGVCYAVKTQDYQPGPAVECPSFERYVPLKGITPFPAASSRMSMTRCGEKP